LGVEADSVGFLLDGDAVAGVMDVLGGLGGIAVVVFAVEEYGCVVGGDHASYIEFDAASFAFGGVDLFGVGQAVPIRGLGSGDAGVRAYDFGPLLSIVARLAVSGGDREAGGFAQDGVGVFGVGDVIVEGEPHRTAGAGRGAECGETGFVAIPLVGVVANELDGAGTVVEDFA